MFSKTHHTAVAVLPPEEIWEPIQAIRRRHDRQFRRWMPHINLLYPFVPRAQWATAVPLLTAATQRIQRSRSPWRSCGPSRMLRATRLSGWTRNRQRR